MAKMVQFQNGDWRDPKDILGVTAFHQIDYQCGVFTPPRVIVYFRGGDSTMIECSTFEIACEMRDEIAARINGARDNG